MDVPDAPDSEAFEGSEEETQENDSANEAAEAAARNAERTGSDVDKREAEAAKERQTAANKKLLSTIAQKVGSMDPTDADAGVDELLEMFDGLDTDDPSATREAVKNLSPKATKVLQTIADTSQTLNDGVEKQAKKAGKSAEYNEKLNALRKAQIEYTQSYVADGDSVSEQTRSAEETFNDKVSDMQDLLESFSDSTEETAEEGGVEEGKKSMVSKLGSLLTSPGLWKALGGLGAIVGFVVLLNKLAKSETGCYLVRIEGDSSKDSYTKIAIPDEDHKNCCVCYDGECSGKTTTECDAKYTPTCANSANPKCAGVVGSPGSVYYTWQDVTAAQVLAGIPGAVINEFEKVAGDAAGLLFGLGMKTWIGILVGIVVLIIVITLAVHFGRRKKT